ncbi:hypothetical protein [Ligilactobacillus salivarius]|uniref:hypothetical protein n=1 Tax=Ligilactobacillus salivarius TaxID=1624 RepID=UPI000BB03F95|nr:hypothetical protein [Ligilactobacillus salivarius]MBE7387236.1 hypothetical protein [Ligilactobacillus salivarius]MBE7391630.1 hypothetical protein [Ligilactobacillus salivarius]PAY33516.1 hypothetical protein A8C54_02060 [Ligilactobacillus salivarius]PAY39770.1 hypothetical protein A8C34_07965 [Ligilactobacillus salivarius]PAY45114.1 hypothetical protein A8C55_01765 [Ligilactobacillus salivarius]
MNNLAMLLNNFRYKMIGTFVGADNEPNIQKSTGKVFYHPVALFKDICLEDGTPVIDKYWFNYVTGLRRLGKLEPGTRLSFFVYCERNRVIVELNKDEFGLMDSLSVPTNFERIDGSVGEPVPVEERPMSGYIFVKNKQKNTVFDERQQWYVDQYMEWKHQNPRQTEEDLENFEVVKSEKLSRRSKERFIVVSKVTGEILDTGDDRKGYTSVASAYAGFDYKMKYLNPRIRYRRRCAKRFLLQHGDFDKKLMDIFDEIDNKGSWEGFMIFDEKIVEYLLNDEGYNDLEFKAKDLYEAWNTL